MLREVRPVQVTSQDLSYKIKAFVSDAWVSPKSKKKNSTKGAVKVKLWIAMRVSWEVSVYHKEDSLS